jgi:hypothetical protein
MFFSCFTLFSAVVITICNIHQYNCVDLHITQPIFQMTQNIFIIMNFLFTFAILPLMERGPDLHSV